MSNQNQGFTSTVLKLRFMFHEYYKTNPDSIDVPENVHNREFGIQSWEYNWFCPKRKVRDESGRDTIVGNQGHHSHMSKNAQSAVPVMFRRPLGGGMLAI